MNLAYNDYLQHHGIKGQKWGVRRYQNPDGTLTSEGKGRYSDTTSKDGNRVSEKKKATSKNNKTNKKRKKNKKRKFKLGLSYQLPDYGSSAYVRSYDRQRSYKALSKVSVDMGNAYVAGIFDALDEYEDKNKGKYISQDIESAVNILSILPDNRKK